MARRIGGVWKVAYADFVTALMALFIVLWLIRSGREVRAAVAGYFRDPLGYQRLSGSAKAGSGETMAATTSNVEELKKHLEEAMRQLPDAQKLPLRRVHGHRRRSANRAHGETGRFVFRDRQFPPNDERRAALRDAGPSRSRTSRTRSPSKAIPIHAHFMIGRWKPMATGSLSCDRANALAGSCCRRVCAEIKSPKSGW